MLPIINLTMMADLSDINRIGQYLIKMPRRKILAAGGFTIAMFSRRGANI